MAASQHYFLANTLVQYSHKRNQMGNYAYWLTSVKQTHSLRTTTLITTIRSVQMQHNIWPGKTRSVSLIAPRHITTFKWPTSNQSNSLHSNSEVEHSHTEDWHKDLVVPYRRFRASYTNISTQSSKPINVNNKWTILA